MRNLVTRARAAIARIRGRNAARSANAARSSGT